ncbi:MAG TPA: hypothetical protein VMC07_01890 [Candidatus Omnitrophota bacterium]|nr:hypothetical protein [Candidatus Omnitrophota bacterium]
MQNEAKAALRLLDYLEKIFPKHIVTDSRTLAELGNDADVIDALEKDGLVERTSRATPNLSSAVSYRITSLGIQFLNQARQKKTNQLLLILTVLFTLFSLAQLIIMLIK